MSDRSEEWYERGNAWTELSAARDLFIVRQIVMNLSELPSNGYRSDSLKIIGHREMKGRKAQREMTVMNLN